MVNPAIEKKLHSGTPSCCKFLGVGIATRLANAELCRPCSSFLKGELAIITCGGRGGILRELNETEEKYDKGTSAQWGSLSSFRITKDPKDS